jgi:hypothetical protein
LGVTGIVTLANNLVMGDDDKIVLGAGSDFEIYHDGSHTRMYETGTGNLTIGSSLLNIVNAAGNADMAYFTEGGLVSLYYNGNKKFETTNIGATVTGSLLVSSASNESFIKISDDDTNAYIGAEASAAWFGMDSAIASGSNLGIYADGRGLSQFTAKFWAVVRSVPSTPVFRDSHNCASITDHAEGDVTVNLTNDMGQADYCVVASGGSATNNPSDKSVATVPVDAGAVRLEIYNTAGTHHDLEYISVLGFAD